MMRARVFVWYSHPLFAQAMAALLSREGMEMAGAEEDPSTALAAIMETRPDVVITDTIVEREHPTGIAEIIRSCDPVRVLVLDLIEEEMRVYDSHGCGAKKLATVVRAIEEAAGRSTALTA